VFFDRVLSQAKEHMSDEHFTVDGTLIEACASQKSFERKMAAMIAATSFGARSGPMKRIGPRLIQMPNCTAKGTDRRPTWSPNRCQPLPSVFEVRE
jgi:hypothetical protein